MTRRSRIVVTAASLALLLLYVFPLWRIGLEAPQYPEGLGMEIWAHTVAGAGPYDLNNINNLNHYIGMKRIEPDAIPELRIMPWIIALLSVLGLATAAAGKRWMLYGWVGLLLVVSVAGLADFYMWAYDYGHNLDHEHAIIKIPGMSYQPPLLGSKQLLNFRATSWPHVGGWIAILAVGLATGSAFLELRRARGRAGRFPEATT